MTAREKILAYMAARRMGEPEFSEFVEISRSNVWKYLRDEDPKEVSILHGKRIAEKLNWSLDYLYFGDAYPPPRKTDKGVILTDAQKAILELVKEVSGPDPNYTEARRRLLGLAAPASKPIDLTPDGPTYADIKAARKNRRVEGN